MSYAFVAIQLADLFVILVKLGFLKPNLAFMLNRKYLYLYVLGVSPTHQGKGLGTLLVQKMIDSLPQGISLYLETESDVNVRFYERLGFHTVKEFRIPDIDLPMWEMLHNGN